MTKQIAEGIVQDFEKELDDKRREDIEAIGNFLELAEVNPTTAEGKPNPLFSNVVYHTKAVQRSYFNQMMNTQSNQAEVEPEQEE